MSEHPEWGAAARLTLPLLLLDEFLIHIHHYRPRPEGQLNISRLLYPSPGLFADFRSSRDVARWVEDNFDLDVHFLVTQSGTLGPIHDEVYERRRVTARVGNLATIILYQDICEMVASMVPDKYLANAVAFASLKRYFERQRRALLLQDARPIAFNYARRLAIGITTQEASCFAITSESPDFEMHVESLQDQFIATGNATTGNKSPKEPIDRRLAIIRCLELLEPEEASLLLLRFCYDLSFEQLASMRTCDVPTIRRLVGRAMKSFEIRLEEAQ